VSEWLVASPEISNSLSTVIVRLDRTIQYSRAPVMESKSRGVLDTRRSLSSGAHSRDPVEGMTTEHTPTFSRHPSPEFCKSFAPKKQGAGKTGCALHW
jgi:hypothetical protein